MVDTVKLRRLDRRRPQDGPTGRVEHDSRGNAFWKRTRATDSLDPPAGAGLALVDEPSSSADPKPNDPKKPSSKKKDSKQK